MISNVLMFRRANVCYDTLNIFTDKVASCLNNRGIKVDFINLDSKDVEGEIYRVINKRYDACLTFNSVGQHGFKVNGQFLLDYMKVPFYNYIVDHPMRHYKHLCVPLKSYHVLCLDMGHEEYISKHHTNIKSVHTLPLGGWVNEGKGLKPIGDRRYDVVMTGSYYSLSDIEDTILKGDKQFIDLTIATINYMLDNRSVSNEEALEAVLEANSIEVDDSAFAMYLNKIDRSNHYVNAYVREEVVRYIIDSGASLHLFGDGWDKLNVDDWKNTVIHKGVPYTETADIYADAKVVLNTMPWFKKGLHDRVPTAMLNGAVALTDTTEYIDNFFRTEGDDAELLTFDIANPGEAVEKLDLLLSDTALLEGISERGRLKALNDLTWESRVDQMIKIFEENKINA
ncbi:MAG: glycosyltransferase family 1 protein [Lachnospiraceae bacterium]|nr:glycosyltransferase family 1 protein [Lachnospiraceae bacterium]